MTTEGTYPYVVGGVSSWCELLIDGIDDVHWQILPVVAGNRRHEPIFRLPNHAELLPPIALWCDRSPPGGGRRRPRPDLPAELARGLLRWSGDRGRLREVFVWCRLNPAALRPTFHSRTAWDGFLGELGRIVNEDQAEVGPFPRLDVYDAARMYQTLYWLARAAATPTLETDLLMTTAAGWSAVPALVHQSLQGTPLVLG